MSEEIKLGWYQHRINPHLLLEVVYSSRKQHTVKIFNQLSIWDEKQLRDCFKYIGTELGEWVSPDDVKFSELPIRARFRNYDLADWYESQLAGIEIRKSGTLSYACVNCDWFSQCQVWRAKK